MVVGSVTLSVSPLETGDLGSVEVSTEQENQEK